MIQASYTLLIALTLRLILVPEPEEVGYIVTDEVVNEKALLELRKIMRKSKK